MQGRFGVECIKDRLDEVKVYSFFGQGLHLFFVSCAQIVKGEGAECWIFYIGRHRKRTVCWTDRGCYEARSVGS
ncbi:hypothetical protein EVA_15165 [gut metagenome]|uniref:Uncharacterized protein n=1 Tax=gut metagenome TaxID=749906 RepID=J9FP69_9ZZZZ